MTRQDRLFIALLAAATPLVAAELQAEGAVDTRIGLSQRWDVVWHNRARVRATTNDWYDVSLIPIFRYRASKDVELFGGAFFTWFEYPRSWKTVARPFAGVEPGLHRERYCILSRTGYERFAVVDGKDFNRYRQRFRIRGNGKKWVPYANVEFFFLNDGIATTRYGAGARRELGRHDGIEFTYWHETEKVAGPGARHMFAVTFHFKFKGLAPDI